jgi:hypothetical protein
MRKMRKYTPATTAVGIRVASNPDSDVLGTLAVDMVAGLSTARVSRMVVRNL